MQKKWALNESESFFDLFQFLRSCLWSLSIDIVKDTVFMLLLKSTAPFLKQNVLRNIKFSS